MAHLLRQLYDLLEKVESLGIGSQEGSLAPSVLALRQEYERWEIPRNLKKSTSRQLRAEVQGAQVDGEEGVAYPRESKLMKYVAAALSLIGQDYVIQKQLQVVCGGLVYISMFRRPLLGCLNTVWVFIESFNRTDHSRQRFPDQCKAEIIRLVSLIPLARLDFRLPFHHQVTCSDASTTGGGICASLGTSRWGALVSEGQLRGQLPELHQEHQVLTIGLFDGISAYICLTGGHRPAAAPSPWACQCRAWPPCKTGGGIALPWSLSCVYGSGGGCWTHPGVGQGLLPSLRSACWRRTSLSRRQWPKLW